MLNFFRSLSIQRKLLLIYAGGFFAFTSYFVASITLSQTQQIAMQELIQTQLPVLESADQIEKLVATCREQISKSSTESSLVGLHRIENLYPSITASLKRMKDLLQSANQNEKEVLSIERIYIDTQKAATDLDLESIAGHLNTAVALERLESLRSRLTTFEKMVATLRTEVQATIATSLDQTKNSSRMILLVGLVLLSGILPFSFLFLRILRRVNLAVVRASSQLYDAAEKILKIAASAQISSHELAANSSLQTSSIQESVSSMEEMKAMLNRTLNHSREALESSNSSYRESLDGKVSVQSMRQAVEEIDRSYNEIENFISVVHEIRNKTRIINDIVFKTQLLSFNASIEAARAGQHGRGFSVVAEEVGALAKSSGQAAVEIEKLLERSIRQISTTVERAQKSVSQAESVSASFTNVFERITERAGQTKSMVAFIQSASSEQYSGIQSVGESMTSLNQAARASDDLAHDLTDLSQSLQMESAALSQTVSELKQLVRQGSQESNNLKRSA